MIELKICTEGSCSNKGAYAVFRAVVAAVEAAGLEDEVDLYPASCLKDCNRGGVCAAIGDKHYGLYPETAEAFVRDIVAPLCQQ